MIQHFPFESGGFVLHKVMIRGKKYSAWFRRNGELIDAERVKDGRTVTVPLAHTKVIAELERIAKRYVPKMEAVPSSV